MTDTFNAVAVRCAPGREHPALREFEEQGAADQAARGHVENSAYDPPYRDPGRRVWIKWGLGDRKIFIRFNVESLGGREVSSYGIL